MGADLIGTVLVIDKDKEPDWREAGRWAQNLTEAELFGEKIESAFDQFAPFEEDYAVGADLGEMTHNEIQDVLFNRKSAIQNSISIAREIYEGGYRNTMDFYVRGARVWVLAEMSWGDSPEGFDEIWFFIMNGAAEAAGFDGE